MNIKTNGHFKHLLHTVLLLVMTGWTLSAYAEDEVIFSMTTNVASTKKVANGETIAGTEFATTVGGSVTYQNNHNTTAYEAVRNSMFYLGTSSCFFKIELDKPLQTGDKIKFAEMPKTSNDLTGISINKTSSDSKEYTTTTDVFKNVVYEVPEGLNGAQTIYLFRVQGKGTFFNNMTITRENPTINISSNPATNLATNTTYYIDAQGNYTTEQPASYVATYRCTNNNKDHGNLGTVITIPNATEGRYTVELGGCQYNNGEYTIKSNNGAFEDITIPESETKTTACNEKITRSFLVTNPTTITITGGGSTYLPFFSVVQKVGFAVNITYVPEGSGTVDVDGSLFKNGEEVTMTATPNHGYEFKEWRDANGNKVNGLDGSPNKYTFTMGYEDVTYKAVFTELPLYSLTTGVEPSEGGKITNKDTYSSHPAGETITLSAVPNTGWSFSHWEKGKSSVSKEITYSF